MRSWSVFWKNEQGDILPFALAALAMGVLLIAPLLAHVSSSHTTVDASRAIMGRHYASDAGVEYALYVLQHDPDVRETAIALRPTPVSLDAPTTVNGETPSVEILYMGDISVSSSAPATETLRYVLWADSLSANHTIQTTGSGHAITGDVHSNYKIFISGSGHVITGTVSYVDSFDESGVTIVPGPAKKEDDALQMPITWTLNGFAPGGSYAVAAANEGKYYQHSSWPYGGAGAVVPEGLHYVTGSVSMQGSSITRPNVTIVATGDIGLSGSSVGYTPYITAPVPLVFFADYQGNNKGINLSGSDVRIQGVSYAPRGEISLTGSGGVIKGAFIGGVVKVAGSGAQIELEPIWILDNDADAATGSAQVYDVRSTAGGTETTARLWKNEDGTWRILSWFVQ